MWIFKKFLHRSKPPQPHNTDVIEEFLEESCRDIDTLLTENALVVQKLKGAMARLHESAAMKQTILDKSVRSLQNRELESKDSVSFEEISEALKDENEFYVSALEEIVGYWTTISVSIENFPKSHISVAALTTELKETRSMFETELKKRQELLAGFKEASDSLVSSFSSCQESNAIGFKRLIGSPPEVDGEGAIASTHEKVEVEHNSQCKRQHVSASDMISPKEYIVSEVCSPVTDVPRDEHAQEKEYIGASVDIYELNAKTPDPLLLSPTIPSQEI